MRFVCESCRAQYMINDEKVGPRGRYFPCRKCGYKILIKRPVVEKAGGPVAMSNDPDDALATQVLQTPLAAAAEATLNEELGAGNEELTNPGTVPAAPAAAAPEAKVDTSNFFGADEDEIGAVFDQVLKSGAHPVPPPESLGGEEHDDDRQSTRVIDADTVRKLAQESGASEGQEREPAPAPEEVPQTDWYVAIDEKQTGPLTLENIKDHWDRGEITPDSLCWRAGFDDWIPVSEVKGLNGVLAPKPPRPIVVAPAASPQSAPVVSVPVQSAFSAGGVMQTVQAEVQVPMAAAAAEAEEPSWKPSAASALASLVKDEMDALARPAPVAPPPSAPEPVATGGGLLDLPVEDERKPAGATVVPSAPRPPAPPPANPYLANPGATYSAPAVTQYRPPNNRGLIIGIAGGAIALLLVLIGLIVWLGTREPTVVVQQQPVQPPPVVVAQAPVQAPVAQPTATAPTPTPTPPTTEAAPAATPPPAEAAAEPKNPSPAPPTPRTTSSSSRSSPRVAARERDTSPPPAPEPKAEPKKSGKGDDDFDSLFGTSSKKEAAAAKEEPKKTPKDVYVPPAPGAAGGVKDDLEQGDIMETVLAHKAQLLKCTDEQKKREPGVSGKLVMKWTVQTSGKVSNVSVVTDEFKGTYMASCVGGLVKTFVFPRHKNQHEPIQFPFKF